MKYTYIIILFAILTNGTFAEMNKNIELKGFECAKDGEHMIEWLGKGKNYKEFLTADVYEELIKQQPGSVLMSLECTGTPEYETAALPEQENSSKAIVHRFMVSFPLLVTVKSSNNEVWVLTVKHVYEASNLHIPNERKLLQHFNVLSAKQT